MTAFDKAVGFVLAQEGGYNDNPDDGGKETNFGISKKAFPDIDIKALDRTRAIELYRVNYWINCRCGFLPSPVAFVLFDAAVNQGPSAAVKCLQRALKVEADGVLGAVTMGAVQKASIRQLIPELIAQRAVLYATNPNVKTFGLGWFRRLSQCHSAALETSL